MAPSLAPGWANAGGTSGGAVPLCEFDAVSLSVIDEPLGGFQFGGSMNVAESLL